MLQILCYLLLSYLSIVAQFLGTPLGPVSAHLPAMVMVLAVRWFSPSVAALWAFCIGLAVDALGTGPLGIHAAILVLIAAALSRGGHSTENSSTWRAMRAVFFAAWCEALVPPAIELLPSQRWQLLQQSWTSCTVSALGAAAFAGLIIGLMKHVTPQPRWTEG